LKALGIPFRNEVMEFYDRKLVYLSGPEGITVQLAEWLTATGDAAWRSWPDALPAVTGAASGIGRGLARCFAGADVRVVLTDIREEALQRTVEELAADGAAVLGVPTDVAELGHVERLAERALIRFGAVLRLCR
jgi:hypothetical protein